MYLVARVFSIASSGAPSIAVTKIGPPTLDVMHRIRLWVAEGKGLCDKRRSFPTGYFCIPDTGPAWFGTRPDAERMTLQAALFSYEHRHHFFAKNGPDDRIKFDKPSSVKVVELGDRMKDQSLEVKLSSDGKVTLLMRAYTSSWISVRTNEIEVDELFKEHELVEIDWRHLRAEVPEKR